MGSPYSKLAPISAVVLLAPTVFAAAPPGQKLIISSQLTGGTYISNAPDTLGLENLSIDLHNGDGNSVEVELQLSTPGATLHTVPMVVGRFNIAITESDEKLKSEGCIKPEGSYGWNLQWALYPLVSSETIAVCPGVDGNWETVRIILNRSAYGTQGAMVLQLQKGKPKPTRSVTKSGIQPGSYIHSFPTESGISKIRVFIPARIKSILRSGDITFTIVKNGHDYSTSELQFRAVKGITLTDKDVRDYCFLIERKRRASGSDDTVMREIKAEIYPGKTGRWSMMLCLSDTDPETLLLYPGLESYTDVAPIHLHKDTSSGSKRRMNSNDSEVDIKKTREDLAK